MGMLSDFTQNYMTDGLTRGGAMNTSGTANSSAVCNRGLWAASTAYVVGDTIVPAGGATGAGGKFLRCTTAGTSGATFTAALGNPGTTVADNTVTWTVLSGMPSPLATYIALLTCTKGARANSTAYALNDTIALTANDTKIHHYKCTTAGTTAAAQSTLYPGVANEAIADGTATFTEQNAGLDSASAILVEVTGGSYARAPVNATLANWAGTQAPASTTSSSGTSGATSNNAVITYATPLADWTPGTLKIWGWAELDALTGGNLLNWGPLTVLQSVLNGQAAPSFAAASLTKTIGN